MAGHTRGAQGGRETFGGSHFLAQPGGGRCQTPGGRSEGGEAPAATPPFALQDGHLSPRREAGGSGGREEAVRPGAAAEEGDRPGPPAAGWLSRSPWLSAPRRASLAAALATRLSSHGALEGVAGE